MSNYILNTFINNFGKINKINKAMHKKQNLYICDINEFILFYNQFIYIYTIFGDSFIIII